MIYYVDCFPTRALPYVMGPFSSYDQAVSEKEKLEVEDVDGRFEVRGELGMEPEAFL